jgi:hypothetical protein
LRPGECGVNKPKLRVVKSLGLFFIQKTSLVIPKLSIRPVFRY